MVGASETSLNPLRLWKQGFNWQGHSTRSQFTLVALLFLLCIGYAFATTTRPELSTPSRIEKIIAFLMLALIWLPYSGHVLRRLNHLGRSGWWYWLTLVPYLTLIFMLYLAIARGQNERPNPTTRPRQLGYGAAWLVTALLASRLFWEPFWIPSGSMKPTLLVGDVLVATYARSAPSRGDIIVFRHPTRNAEFIKRVIALPGETVEIRSGIVHINGVAVPQASLPDFVETKAEQGPARTIARCSNRPINIDAPCIKQQTLETLPNGQSYPVLNIGNYAVDDTSEFIVPDGHYFVLGDNRDNSRDSRLSRTLGGVGMIPAQDVIARARFVLYSSPGKGLWQVWTWRANRIMKPLQ